MKELKTYIALLRGINVGGHRIVKMDLLRSLFEELFQEAVKTYIQSGNVVFKSKPTSIDELTRIISEELFAKFGFEIKLIVIELEDLDILLKNNPFLKMENVEIKELHATLLSKHPAKENLSIIEELIDGDDKIIIKDRCIYLLCKDGYGNTKLTNGFFEKILKVEATTRNWKTLMALHEIGNSMN